MIMTIDDDDDDNDDTDDDNYVDNECKIYKLLLVYRGYPLNRI